MDHGVKENGHESGSGIRALYRTLLLCLYDRNSGDMLTAKEGFARTAFIFKYYEIRK